MKLTEAMIRAGASEQSLARGQDYYRHGAIDNTVRQGQVLSADCAGNSAPYYRVRVELGATGVRSARCTCPYDFGGWCKHIVALLLTYLHEPERFAERLEPAALLADLSREELAAILGRLLADEPELYDRVAGLAASMAAGSGQGKRRPVDVETYRRRVAHAFRNLGSQSYYGYDEEYQDTSELVDELAGVKEEALRFLDAGDVETALAILLVLTEETARRLDDEEYYDDEGSLDEFFDDLDWELAEVILDPARPEALRTGLARRLQVLVKPLTRRRLVMALAAARYGWDGEPAGGASAEEVEQWESTAQEMDQLKLNILERLGRTEEFLALCRQTESHLRYALKLCELGRTSEAAAYAMEMMDSAVDALVLAQRLYELGRVSEAAALGERGLELGASTAQLAAWLAPIEEELDRTAQALAAWQVVFAGGPSLEAYRRIKRLAGESWAEVRPQLMAVLEQPQWSQALVQVLLAEQQWDRATEIAERPHGWLDLAEMVAGAVMAHRPEWVRRISIERAEKLMYQPQSGNYPRAAKWLERAKQAYAQLGRTGEWQAYLQELKERYPRRRALQAHLARL